jgi:hypothetical protein
MRIIGSGYVGDMTPSTVFSVPFATLNDDGSRAEWGGLAKIRDQHGLESEGGVNLIIGPNGHHVAVVNVAAAITDSIVAPGNDYRLMIDGDAIGDVPVQGVCVGHFSVLNRS